MKKNKVISLIALLTASVLLLVGSVFAWFVLYDMMSGVDLTIAKIDSLITLYKGLDGNYDGILDRDEVTGKPLYTQVWTPMPAIGNESVEIDMIMDLRGKEISEDVFEGILPSYKCTFKFNIVNNSDARNEIRISFLGYPSSFWNAWGEDRYEGKDSAYFLQCLRALSVTVKVLEQDGTVARTTDKIFLANALQGEIDLIEEVVIQAYVNNKVDILLIFEFESYDNLVGPINEGGAGLIMSREEYNAFQGASFVLPLLRIYLEIPYESES